MPLLASSYRERTRKERFAASSITQKGRTDVGGMHQVHAPNLSSKGIHVWQALEEEIVGVCEDKIRRHRRRQRALTDYLERRAMRSSAIYPPSSRSRPEMWRTNRNLDPYDVIKRSASLSHGIRRSIRADQYVVNQPSEILIPKSDGTNRTVQSFEIPDEAVSRLLFKSLTQKNRALFGAHAYAYRDSVGVYDALRYISSEWSGRHRLYVGSFDLKKYFESIDHSYLFHEIESLWIHATKREVDLCRKFVEAARLSDRSNPSPKSTSITANSGIPQGTTVSLFLANLAMLQLDRNLERAGVQFARYADDLVFWSDDYKIASRGVELLYQWSRKSGVAINTEKSMGLKLVTSHSFADAEISSATSISFLGHAISLDAVRPKQSRLKRLKNEVQRLIYLALLKEPLNGTQNLARIARGQDRDYISLIWQLRRKLYGHMSENQLMRFTRGHIPYLGIGGAIAQFSVVTDDTDLREFDRWLELQIWLALKKRSALLRNNIQYSNEPYIWSLPLPKLRDWAGYSTTNSQYIDFTIPSAIRMINFVQRAIRLHGPSIIRSSTRLYLDDSD